MLQRYMEEAKTTMTLRILHDTHKQVNKHLGTISRAEQTIPVFMAQTKH